MNISTISFIVFIFSTLIYFNFPGIGKEEITLEESNKYTVNWTRLVLYYSIVMVSQFIMNSIYLTNKCSGDVGENIWYAFYITLGPWTFIFALLLIVLNSFPDIKSAFSDVFGYFYISKSANEIFSKLLVGDKEINNNINDLNISDNKKDDLIRTSDAIIKIMGNKSVFINQMTTTNFLNMWEIFEPLMKTNIDNKQDLKTKLFELVRTKDNIGEMMWYIYTGILVISIVSYKLTIKECSPNLKIGRAHV